MWEAARLDAEAAKIPEEDHLATIQGSFGKFFREGGLFDREDLLAALHKSLACEGTFTLILGGKNVGKSLVMETVARKHIQEKDGRLMVTSIMFHPSPHSISFHLIPSHCRW